MLFTLIQKREMTIVSYVVCCSLTDLPGLLSHAFYTSTSGRPGATYVDLPSDILLQRLPSSQGNTKADVVDLVKGLLAQAPVPKLDSTIDAGETHLCHVFLSR